MIVIGAVGFVIVRRSATSGAIRQAKDLTQLAGRGIAAPLITPGVLRGDPAELARLDRVVHERILHDTPIVRVKVWDARGRVVYSDARQVIGSVFALDAGDRQTLLRGGTKADASDLNRPENRSERGFKRLLEVYVGIRGPDGSRLLYEDYERSSTISASSRRQWAALLPALVGALLVLYLVQVPLAYSLARRLRARQREREELLRRAIDASDLERRRIAADLHDTAVQRLAGVSLSLAASAGTEGGDRAQTRQAFARAAAETRETIRELRTLLVDIYPPTLQRSGLLAALKDLVAPLQTAGIEVSLQVPDPIELPDDTEALLYRVSQEAVRNARTHGNATKVEVAVRREPHGVVLSVVDNGRGFSTVEVTGTSADQSLRHAPDARSERPRRRDPGRAVLRRRRHVRPARGAVAVIRLLIADDHPLVRDALAVCSTRAEDISVVAAAENGRDAVAVALETSPDVVLMDLEMPVLGGIEAIRTLKAEGSSAHVVVLTTFSDRDRILGALDAGALGYMLKDADPEEIIRGGARSRARRVTARAAGRARADQRARRDPDRRGAERARARGPGARRRGTTEQADRPAPGDQREDGEGSPDERVRADRRHRPHAGGAVGPAPPDRILTAPHTR